jgi:hypothetical protein
MKMKKLMLLLLMPSLALAGGMGDSSLSISNQNQQSTSTSGATNQGNTQQFISNGATGLNYQGGYSVENVPNVQSPGLTSSYGANWNSCLGSVSQSVNALGFGESAGTTVQLEACIRAQNARLMAELGAKPIVSKEIMCGDREINMVYKVLAKNGIDTACLTEPSSSVAIPGGTVGVYRGGVTQQAAQKPLATVSKPAVQYPASEKLMRYYGGKR